ncbi:MAG: hydantoinase B/oxoprolinase family protein [Rhodanobacter sp.]
MYKLNPIFLEVFWTRTRSLVDEAAKLIVRTSFSTLSTEANDFAVVLTDSKGRSLVENSGSVPSFIGTLPATVRSAIVEIGSENMRPGDVYITNNPWTGTGHLNDFCFVKPIFHNALLVAFSATAAHMPDIGGRIRSVEARELFEEGFHIPMMLLLREGVADESLLKLLRTNVRTPEQTVGDVWSQVAATELVDRRLQEVMTEYDLADINTIAEALFDRSEEAMRRAIAALPEGEYDYAIETDGFETPFTFAVKVIVKNSQITCDFEGTSPQQPRGINCVLAYTYAMTVYAIKCLLLPDLPNNDGLFRAIHVKAPEGSLVNPKYPAAVGGRACTGHYVPNVVFGALHAILPNRVMAGVGSPLWIVNMNGLRPNGKPFATVFFFNGGMGATARKDGNAAMSWPSNISPTPVEIAERDGPFHFHYKKLVPGSGGAGCFRGGLAQEICFEVRHSGPLSIVFLTERLHKPALGLAEGSPGQCGAVLINGQPVDARRQHVIQFGDQVVLRTPGGGGYGAVAKRPPTAVELDKLFGYT